eukprot:23518-Rhodomonas_salina.1
MLVRRLVKQLREPSSWYCSPRTSRHIVLGKSGTDMGYRPTLWRGTDVGCCGTRCVDTVFEELRIISEQCE